MKGVPSGRAALLHNLICRDSRSGLIIARVKINGCSANAVIDTGASASFLPEQGEAASLRREGLIPTQLRTRVADNGKLDATLTLEAEMRLEACNERTSKNRFIVINRSRTILGYDVLFGTEPIKKLGINIKPVGERLVAMVNGVEIGHEDTEGLMKCCFATQGTVEKPERLGLARLLDRYRDVFAETAEGTI